MDSREGKKTEKTSSTGSWGKMLFNYEGDFFFFLAYSFFSEQISLIVRFLQKVIMHNLIFHGYHIS